MLRSRQLNPTSCRLTSFAASSRDIPPSQSIPGELTAASIVADHCGSWRSCWNLSPIIVNARGRLCSPAVAGREHISRVRHFLANLPE